MTFPEILKEIMIEQSLNQVKLSKMTGLKQGHISDWLLGKSQPNYDSLKILCKILQESADRLLGLK